MNEQDDRQLAEEPEGYTFKADEEICDLIKAYKELKKSEKKFKNQADKIKKEIMECMQDAQQIVTSDGEQIVTYKYDAPSLSFDEQAFQKSYPNLYQDFMIVKDPTRRFLVK